MFNFFVEKSAEKVHVRVQFTDGQLMSLEEFIKDYERLLVKSPRRREHTFKAMSLENLVKDYEHLLAEEK